MWIQCLLKFSCTLYFLFFFFQVFELLNFLAENFVFLYIGVSVFTYEETKWDPWFILAAFVSFYSSLRKHAHAIYQKNFVCKNEKFHWKIFYIFLIFAQNIDCGYTLEPPR